MRAMTSPPAAPEQPARRPLALPEVGLLAVIVVIGAALRLPDIDAWYWGDEIQTVVISDRSIFDIPDALERDGAPPLFYFLLNAWMVVFGSSETSTHTLTLVLSLLTVVAAWWFARRHAGRWAGLLAAGAVAVNPYLVTYATETRNYALFALLGVIAGGLALDVLAARGGRAHLLLGVVLGLTMLTHAWGLFFTVALAGALLLAALLARDRALASRALVALGIAAVVFLPWAPTFIDQRRHTGAPWNVRYSITSTLDQLVAYLGDRPVAAVVGIAVVVALVAAVRASRLAIDPLIVALGCVTTLALAFLASYIDPIWQARYGIVVLGALLLVASIVASRTTIGTAAFVVALLAMLVFTVRDVVDQPQDGKPDAELRTVAASIRPASPAYALADQGTLCNLRYHLGDDAGSAVTYVSPIGVLEDPTFYDWRDDLDRLRAADPGAVVDRVVGAAQPGDTFVAVTRGNVTEGTRAGAADGGNEWTARYDATTQELVASARSDARLVEIDRSVVEGWTVITLQRR